MMGGREFLADISDSLKGQPCKCMAFSRNSTMILLELSSMILLELLQEAPLCFHCTMSVPLEQHLPHIFILKCSFYVFLLHLRSGILHWSLSPPIMPGIWLMFVEFEETYGQ